MNINTYQEATLRRQHQVDASTILRVIDFLIEIHRFSKSCLCGARAPPLWADGCAAIELIENIDFPLKNQ